MSQEGMVKFALSLRQLHEAAKAMAHVLGSLRKSAEDEACGKMYPVKVTQDEAQLIAWMSEPKYIGAFPARPESATVAAQMDFFRDKVIAAMGVPQELLDPEGAKKVREKIFTDMLAQSGLPAWLEDLQNLVDELKPDQDLLTFKRQVEALVNDSRIRRLGARLFRAENSGKGHEGPSQANDHR